MFKFPDCNTYCKQGWVVIMVGCYNVGFLALLLAESRERDGKRETKKGKRKTS